MMRAMGGGLSTLEALPRDDLFWCGRANDRVTVHKLQACAGDRLERSG